jgi:hypothetical protein
VEGPVGRKLIEETFAGNSEVLRLSIGGQTIRTTPEHPFYEMEKGWVGAGDLAAGDLLATNTGNWLKIDAVTWTGEVVPVYNFRVADWHTYFVGSPVWGFGIWVHNSYNAPSTALNQLQSKFDELAEGNLIPKYLELDPNLKWGYTGSFKTGTVGNQNKSTFGQPINLSNFDVDVWIKSDILYGIKGSKLRADVEFRKLLSNTPGFEGLRPNKKVFSIKFGPSQ